MATTLVDVYAFGERLDSIKQDLNRMIRLNHSDPSYTRELKDELRNLQTDLDSVNYIRSLVSRKSESYGSDLLKVSKHLSDLVKSFPESVNRKDVWDSRYAGQKKNSPARRSYVPG